MLSTSIKDPSLSALEQARRLVNTYSHRLIALTGAGISAEAGISTFRDVDTGALWGEYDPEAMSSIDGFNEDPELVWGWYKRIRSSVIDAEPSSSHRMLASAEVPIITQNVDLLHEKAGSKNVLHMHGRADAFKCTSCSWRGSYEALVHSDERSSASCPACSALARPDVVWFGEYLDKRLLKKAKGLARRSICLVIGTTAQVQPIASLPALASSIISINTREEDHIAGSIKLTGKASVILQKLFQK